jgi:fibronectin type 3 domain-containing protein
MTTTGYHPVNVQIENSPGARPQSGLSSADIVYECLMERRCVTRFQAVFNDQMPTYVGPVRSCRLYFVSIAEQYKGILAFYGGPSSTDANIYPKLAQALKDGNILIIANGLTKQYHPLYWRITSRPVPHNVYTNLTKTVSLYSKVTQPTPVSIFKFNADADYSASEDMNTVDVEYNGLSYDAKFVYDPTAKNYKRYEAGKPFIDANTRKQITVKNIIVQRADTVDLGTHKGHLNINLVGTGKADVYTDGKHISATWERPTEADVTKFYDASHNEIELQPGNTWVEEVPTEWEPHYFSADSIYYSRYSAAMNVKVGTPSPAANAASYNSIKLTWGKTAAATKYEIYSSTTSGGTLKMIGSTASTSYTVKNVTTGTPCYYKIRAYHLVAGNKIYGDYSTEVTDKTTLAVPTSVKASAASYNSVKITWKGVAGATSYQILRSTDAAGTYTVIGTTGSKSYTNKNVDTGTPYYYKVCAVRAGKAYDASAVVHATTSLSTPSHVSAKSASSTSIKVKWNSVSGASGYEVWGCATAGGTFTLINTVTSASYTDSGLATGTYHFYKVIAYRTVGLIKVYSGYSSVVHAKP